MTDDRNIYLSNMSLQESLEIFFNKINISRGIENILTDNSLDRVTAYPVYSNISSPFYNQSAMDGIATKSSKTIGASEKNHIQLEEGKDYIVVDTGDPIPRDYDCVIMIEDVIRVDEKKVEIYKGAVQWQNIRQIGEDIIENQLIVPSKHIIRPVDIGAILAGGVNTIKVYKKPVVGIIPTGTELVEPGSNLKVGDIIDFNSRVFMAQVIEYGGVPKRYSIVEDNYENIRLVVKRAVDECDIVLINAGSSAGREDFTSKVIDELGDVYVHGIAIKPGKPAILGQINQKPVIGIPGYPVSAFFVMESIVNKLIKTYLNIKFNLYEKVDAVLSKRVMSSLKYNEFIRVKLGYVDNKIIATPISRGAGVTMSLVNADGILNVPQEVEGIEANSIVSVELLKSKEDIKNTILCIGSHDPILDILSDMLHLQDKGYTLASAHVGSMGGIMALKNRETHIAPIHLLDMNTGGYNISYIKKYLGNRNITLIKCVKRIQGIMVPKGNPMNILGLEDIKNKEVRFVNRQRGSGTRLLFDFNLKKLGIRPEQINGYNREDFTHVGVAAKVASNDADCGLGIYSAARIMNLDFIPVCSEEYDIALPTEFLRLDTIVEFIKLLKNEEFHRELDRLGGYDYHDIGKIISIGD